MRLHNFSCFLSHYTGSCCRFSRRRSDGRCTTQSHSLGVAAGPSSSYHYPSVYPRVAPGKESHQLLLHCDIGLPKRYIGTTSDICRPTAADSLPWNTLVDRDVTSESGEMGYTMSDHIYESPSFQTKTALTGVINSVNDSALCVTPAHCKLFFNDAGNCDGQSNI